MLTPKLLANISIIMAIIVLILSIGVIIFPKTFREFDLKLVANNTNSAFKDRIAFWIDRSISWKPITLLYLVWGVFLVILDKITAFGVIGISILSGSLGFWAIKRITQRKRPADARVHYTDYSFPSGHTTTGVIILLSFAYFLTLLIDQTLWAWIFYSLALLGGAVVGRSRRYLKAHRVSDVITARLLGIGFFIFSYLLILYFGDAILESVMQVFFSL